MLFSFGSSQSNFNPRPLAGATGMPTTKPSGRLFQSTPPHGGDVFRHVLDNKHGRFQSTPPHGGDRLVHIWLQGLRDFNPRPLTGATLAPIADFMDWPISIHAPSRGRLGTPKGQNGFFQFQSTPPHGGDLTSWAFPWRTYNFNPRPLTGATLASGGYGLKEGISIHAPSRGRLWWPKSFLI